MRVEAGEQCDDGNTVSGDDCSATCIFEQPNTLVAAASLCGNGVLESPEECDDANRRSGDGCNESCFLEIGICGDGKVEQLLGEQCESSTFDQSLPYKCVKCRFFSQSCGDGTLDPGEECDKGIQNSTSPDAACRPDCSLSRCGDGIRDTDEQCDDDNRGNGDGCDGRCRTESTQGTVLADKKTEQSSSAVAAQQTAYNPYAQNISFPQYPTYQPLPYQLPLAQLQPIMMQTPHTTQTGPAAVAVVASGMAAGLGWVRRKKR